MVSTNRNQHFCLHVHGGSAPCTGHLELEAINIVGGSGAGDIDGTARKGWMEGGREGPGLLKNLCIVHDKCLRMVGMWGPLTVVFSVSEY